MVTAGVGGIINKDGAVEICTRLFGGTKQIASQYVFALALLNYVLKAWAKHMFCVDSKARSEPNTNLPAPVKQTSCGLRCRSGRCKTDVPRTSCGLRSASVGAKPTSTGRRAVSAAAPVRAKPRSTGPRAPLDTARVVFGFSKLNLLN